MDLRSKYKRKKNCKISRGIQENHLYDLGLGKELLGVTPKT